VSGKHKEIKIAACQSLISIQNKYLNIALYFLEDELAKETINKEGVYCLCDYVSIINEIISFFSDLIEGKKGKTFEIAYSQAVVAKTHMLKFTLLKKVLLENYNIFVEIN